MDNIINNIISKYAILDLNCIKIKFISIIYHYLVDVEFHRT